MIHRANQILDYVVSFSAVTTAAATVFCIQSAVLFGVCNMRAYALFVFGAICSKRM